MGSNGRRRPNVRRVSLLACADEAGRSDAHPPGRTHDGHFDAELRIPGTRRGPRESRRATRRFEDRLDDLAESLAKVALPSLYNGPTDRLEAVTLPGVSFPIELELASPKIRI